MQEVDIIVGRPVTEREDLLVFKSPQLLKLTEDKNFFNQLPECVERNEKINLSVSDSTIVRTVINLKQVATIIENGYVLLQQVRNDSTLVIPEHKIQFYNGVLNNGVHDVRIERNTCLVKGLEDKTKNFVDHNFKQTLKLLFLSIRCV